MSKQLHFSSFSDISLAPADDRPEPTVWIRKLAIYSDWPLNEKTNLLRSVDLHKGMNILWAQAGGKNKSKSERKKLSGHATGKTTFCRLLRFILDDANFGNDQFREAFQAKYRNGWALGEVFLDGTLWLVGRPMGRVGYHPFALQDRLITSLHGEALPTGGYELYQIALKKTVFKNIEINTLASSGREFRWDCLIQWLARDQECRFGELLNWRNKMSESDPAWLSNPDKENLIRIILTLVTPEEQNLLREHANLTFTHKQELTLKPKLEYQADADTERLKRLLNGTSLEIKDEKLRLDALIAGVRLAKENLKKEEEDLPKRADEQKLIAALEASSRETGAAVQSLQEVQQHLDYQQALLDAAKGDKSATQRAYSLSKLLPFRGHCSHPLNLAWHLKCPLAEQRTSDEEVDARMKEVSTRAQALQIDVEHLVEDRDNWASRVKERRDAESVALQQLLGFQNERDQKRMVVESKRNRIQLIEQAIQHYDEISKLQTANQEKMDELEGKKDEIDKKLEISKRQHQKTVGNFSMVFDFIAKQMLDSEVEAKVEFSGKSKSIEPVMDYHGRLDSAALSTVKLLAFDLTCLAFSVIGEGHHPRFLVHDSPREADMFVEIYHELFQTVRLLENAAGDESRLNFQYIITTTEAPPEELLQHRWLLKPILNSAQAEGRFLGIDL